MNNRELSRNEVMAMMERRMWLEEADQLRANAERCRHPESRDARLMAAAALRRKAGAC